MQANCSRLASTVERYTSGMQKQTHGSMKSPLGLSTHAHNGTAFVYVLRLRRWQRAYRNDVSKAHCLCACL